MTNHLSERVYLRSGTALTSVSLTEQSASGNSDRIAVSVRLEDFKPQILSVLSV